MVLTVYVHHCCGGHSQKSALLLAALMAMAEFETPCKLLVACILGGHHSAWPASQTQESSASAN